jgi:hypothetical protein
LLVAHSEDLLLLHPHTQRTNTQALTGTFSDLLKLDLKDMGGKKGKRDDSKSKIQKGSP